MRAGVRREILGIRPRDGLREIEFGQPAREVYHLPLLTMLALHVMQIEGNRVNAVGGAG